jgi:Holliday junction resolvase RusA-like endonuclease
MAMELALDNRACGDRSRAVAERSAAADGVIRLVVPFEPVAKGRPRFVRVTGRAYTPPKTALGEWQIRQAFLSLLERPEPLQGPVRMRIDCYLVMPSSVPKRDQLHARPMHRPDLDSYIKSALDGLNGYAYFDDGQVVEIEAHKMYGHPTRWEITVEHVE